MKRRAIVSTHHKSGTVWMAKTFKGIAEKFGIPLEHYDRLDPAGSILSAPSIMLDHGSRWFGKPADTFRVSEDRGFHLIRDPRDTIISAMHYHLISGEEWLHRPSDDFGGLTYQEKLRGFATNKERYIFEMDNSAGRVIGNMIQWDYTRPEWIEGRYENLIQDVEMETFLGTVLPHLGFEPHEIEAAREIYWEQSLFGTKGEKLARKQQKNKQHAHMRSGKPRQWPDVYDRELADAFVERFGDALVTLAYEPDNSWVDRLGGEQLRIAPAAPRAIAVNAENDVLPEDDLARAS